MGRAVGGASAVGCGALGVGGLLVSVAIVFWLASMSLDSTGDVVGNRRSDTTIDRDLTTNGSTITIDAPAELGDGGKVTLAGTDFPDGSLTLTLCLTHGPAAETDPCDPTTTTAAAVRRDGGWEATRALPRVITVGGTPYDCAARADACSIRARLTDRPTDPGLTIAVPFATDLPPVSAEAPPTG